MTLNCSIFPLILRTMPTEIPYSQALTFAIDCTVGVEFIETYGTAIDWIHSMIDVGEFLQFVEDKLNGQ